MFSAAYDPQSVAYDPQPDEKSSRRSVPALPAPSFKGAKAILSFFVLTLALMAFLLSASIALPVLCTPFYSLQIENLRLMEVPVRIGGTVRTLSRDEILSAYLEMIRYCWGLYPYYSSGVLGFSAEGAAHFEDVRRLFSLDFYVLLLSSLTLVSYLILAKKTSFRAPLLYGRSFPFWAAGALLFIFSVVGLLAALDFSSFFTTFHHLFFPGKSNWIFDPEIDQIINILPERYFARAAGLIVTALLLSCAALLLRFRKKVPSF